MVLVGRVARTHGLRGDVVVNPETDFVAERFRPGATMWIRSAAGEEQLTVTTVRLQNGRPVVAFEGFSSIDSADRLTGQELRVPEASLQPLAPGQYYEHQLAGCSVATVGGEEVGVVDRVERGAGGSRLVVRGARGEVLVRCEHRGSARRGSDRRSDRRLLVECRDDDADGHGTMLTYRFG